MLAHEAIEMPHAPGSTRAVDDPAQAVRDAELVIVLGGDGTILRAAELVRGHRAPLLGVNLGHVGFLAESEREDLAEAVDRLAARDYVVEERMTLDVRVSVRGEELARTWAVNEASVEKSSRQRMLEVVTEVDGRPVSTVGCDGVVMATPTGSTAYAFSAGGPVVWPEVEALLMVPISAHALFARPLVVGADVRARRRGARPGVDDRRAVVRRPAHRRPSPRARGSRCGGRTSRCGSRAWRPGAVHRPPGGEVPPAGDRLARAGRPVSPRLEPDRAAP